MRHLESVLVLAASCLSLQFAEDPDDPPTSLGMHRQHVDDVGLVVVAPSTSLGPIIRRKIGCRRTCSANAEHPCYGAPFVRRSGSHDAARIASAARNLFALGRRSLEQGQHLAHRIHAPASDATGISGRTRQTPRRRRHVIAVPCQRTPTSSPSTVTTVAGRRVRGQECLGLLRAGEWHTEHPRVAVLARPKRRSESLQTCYSRLRKPVAVMFALLDDNPS